MKSIILILAIITSSLVNAQVTFEKVKPMNTINRISDVSLIKNDESSYSICYKNTRYTQMVDNKCFTTDKETIKSIGDQILLGFDTPKEMVKFSINDYLIYMKYEKLFGSVTVQFFTVDNYSKITLGSSNSLSKKQISKLFTIN